MQTEAHSDRKLLTASMVNNYVKHGHIGKPFKKKYQKIQVARLIAIVLLKNVFSIQEISQALSLLKKQFTSEVLYDYFVMCLNDEDTSAVPDIILSACQTLKLYQKTRQLTLELEGELSNESNIQT